MRRMFWSVAAGAMVAGLAGCEPREGAGTAGDTTMAVGADTMAVGSDLETTATTGAMTAQMQAVNNSGITGEVTLTPLDERTTVVLALQGGSGAAGQQHAAHIHSGRCNAIGGVVVPLEPAVHQGADGANSTTVVDVPIATIANGDHLVAAHEVGGDPGAPVVCADIPAAAGGGTAGMTGDTAP